MEVPRYMRDEGMAELPEAGRFNGAAGSIGQ